MSSTEEKTQISFRATEEYRSAIKEAALARGVTVQDLLKIAVDAYLFDVPPEFSREEFDLARRIIIWMKRTRTDPNLKHVADMIMKFVEGV